MASQRLKAGRHQLSDAQRVQGFAPLVGPGARVLVLGSLPGVASLRCSQYYAHPRNAFWPIAAALFGFEASLPYAARTTALVQAGVALWDVLGACERAGSLDAAIRAGSLEPNDFAAFFADHPAIRQVWLNGAKAADIYQRRVLPGLPARWAALRYVALPSTSAAHAAASFQDKLHAWRAALDASVPGA